MAIGGRKWKVVEDGGRRGYWGGCVVVVKWEDPGGMWGPLPGFCSDGGVGSEVIHEFHYGCDLCAGVFVGLVAC